MGNAIGTFRTVWDQSLPPKSKFSTDQIPDLTGRVVIVTGQHSFLVVARELVQ